MYNVMLSSERRADGLLEFIGQNNIDIHCMRDVIKARLSGCCAKHYTGSCLRRQNCVSLLSAQAESGDNFTWLVLTSHLCMDSFGPQSNPILDINLWPKNGVLVKLLSLS